eukprot:CAMPEP_0173425030 /NCGR_PEP_ID=MMETSP1357-20121228/4839_1 /TAXON_ID=77926 /ORGANISM="Hemiselmis rufescens, Strain PCC563" /LENGTH=68 /DNA_ID=CAMNT_0014388389 /DNA_START=205 /DNA_END=408 /DNA_ORIENTATION=+
MKFLVRPMHLWFEFLHTVHVSLRLIFLVTLAFLWKIGFFWPPNPCILRSYLLLPCASSRAAPVLYWVT